MPKSSNSSIKFGFWNIGGLCTRGMNKAEDSIFLKNFEPYDIIFLVETHIGYNSKIHNIGNFIIILFVEMYRIIIDILRV